MTALERAARALCGSIAGESRWDKLNESARRSYCKHARAVLMAVREQWLEIYHASEGTTLPTYEQAEGFQDMIDAILNEKDATNLSEEA